MTRPLTLVAVLSIVLGSVEANAQFPPTGIHHINPQPVPSQLPDHDYWHSNVHAPSIQRLDSYSDQLAKIARHLHEDAHKLSQDYEHSHHIEHYVDSLDRLQQHIHTLLHEAAASGYQSTSLLHHVKSDVRQVKVLLSRLYRELEHQGIDGARTADYYAIEHMRQAISNEALPLVRNTEVELYGHALDHYQHSSHRYPIYTSRWSWPRNHSWHW